MFEDTTSIIYPDAIYRFESGVNTTGTHMAELVTAALCLYKVGAVRLGKQISYLDSIVYYDNLTETPGDREKQGIPIIFTETDCKKFSRFLEKNFKASCLTNQIKYLRNTHILTWHTVDIMTHC